MTKVYQIEKRSVYQAWLRVRQNKGAAGCDGLSIQEIEANYKNYLYKLWNRMSSGSYLASPVKKVSIPKPGGKERILGIPTVLDRIAQMVVKDRIEAKLESTFHPDSFGYRPNRSAHDAIGTVRKRNWDYVWVIDLDIQNFFDSIPHHLMVEIVERRVEEKWAKLYIRRWLEASIQDEKGEVRKRTQGTPQGGVLSPLLSNLYLDEVFDWWITKWNPYIKFVRFADDIIIHCNSLESAQRTLEAIKERFSKFGLTIHPEKTRIICTKVNGKEIDYPFCKFTFLGYDFQPRQVKKADGRIELGYIPAVSLEAKVRIKQAVRSWKWRQRVDKSPKDLALAANPMIRGWINYYGKFARYELNYVLNYIDMRLVKWIKSKYKISGHRRAWEKLTLIKKDFPKLFAHW